MTNLNSLSPKKGFLSALAALAILGFCQCSKPNSQSAGNKSMADPKTPAPVIEFRRTPCYGTCPIYRSSVQANGRIRFLGENFTEKVGKFEASMDASVVSELLQEAHNLNFWSYDTLYITGATDFPSMIITIRDQGQSHTIRTEGEGPKELEAYMQKVDAVIMEAVATNAKPVK